MDVKKEIENEKNRQLLLQKQQHSAALEKARGYITTIVAGAKAEVVRLAANNSNIVTRGLFKKRKYVRWTRRLRRGSDFSNANIKLFYIFKQVPEIDKYIISSLVKEGFENVSINREDPDNIYISAWYDIT